MRDEAMTSGSSRLGERLRRGTRALAREAGAAFLRTPRSAAQGAPGRDRGQ